MRQHTVIKTAASTARGVLLLLACAGAGGASAQEQQQQPWSQQHSLPPPAIQSLINTVPVLDGPAGVTSLSRMDMVRWARTQRSALGLSVGLEMPVGPAVDSRYAPALSVGFRWRATLGDGERHLDFASWRRLSPTPTISDPFAGTSQSADTSQYTARVELTFAKPKSMTEELGAIGMQLDSGTKVSLRVRHGGPMLYYRRTF